MATQDQPDQPDPTTAQPAQPEPEPAHEPADQPSRTRLRDRRTALRVPVAAALATGLVVVSGLGGFVIGSATADDRGDRPGLADGGRGVQGFPDGPGGRGGPGLLPPRGDHGVPPDLDDDGDDSGDDGGTEQDSGSST